MIEKTIVAALEPLAADIVAIEKRLDALQLLPGPPGAGIDAPQWAKGAVYRKGTFVVANFGQHFVALKDTASPTDDAEHWARVGSGGFRHRGTFEKDAVYADGDLFMDNYGTFCMVHGVPVLLAGRGPAGKPGEKGLPGANGRDGSTIIGAQVEGFKLVLVQQNGDGTTDHLEADFGPAYREVMKSALEASLPELAQLLADLRDDVDALIQRGRAR
jgi:hypothetical protein